MSTKTYVIAYVDQVTCEADPPMRDDKPPDLSPCGEPVEVVAYDVNRRVKWALCRPCFHSLIEVDMDNDEWDTVILKGVTP